MASAVEVKGEEEPVASCTYPIREGMEIETDSPRVLELRKEILTRFLGKHYGDCAPPCSLACPGDLDVQGYVAHIARGNYLEGLKLIREKIILPGVIGRVCPCPCEDNCRRTRVDGPIQIRNLKRFVAEYAQMQGIRTIPAPAPDSGYRVAIIG